MWPFDLVEQRGENFFVLFCHKNVVAILFLLNMTIYKNDEILKK